jgi:hypothetical protein
MEPVHARYQACHYDSLHHLIVEPLDRIDFDLLTANPGGPNTLWQNGINGHLMVGSTDLQPAGPTPIRNVSIVNNTLTTVITPTLPPGTGWAGRLEYGVNVLGGSSDIQDVYGDVEFSMVNKAGTITSSLTQSSLNTSASTGTFTAAWSVNNVGLIQVTFNSSLSTPVLNMFYNVTNYSNVVLTLL